MTKKKKGGKKLTANQLQIEILKFLLSHPKKQFAARHIIETLGVANNKDSAEHALSQLVLAGSVAEFAAGKFGAALDRLTKFEAEPKKERKKETPVAQASGTEKIEKTPKYETFKSKNARKLIEGRVDMTRTGAAYIVSETVDTDVYVPPKYVNGALNNDIVRVLMFAQPPRRKGGQMIRKPEGEIVEILKRANEFFIGTLRKSRKYGLFLPDNPNMPTDIYVALEDCGTAEDGDKVVVRVTEWNTGKNRAPSGRVTQVLGVVGGNDFEMKKILINAGFDLDHGEEARREAEAIPENISPQEIERRMDFRDVLTFTIDPEDAKDFDDALSFRRLDEGRVEIGIHIADVTYYLKPDSPLDREAFARSTSVYLVDRCNPMLPEKLSNNLCSLVPEKDRLTFSAVFVFDGKDKITSRRFGKSVIHSAKRFSYEEAQLVLEGNPAPETAAHPRYAELREALETLNGIAGKMRKAREKNGAIGFETDEVRFKLAPDGTPIATYVKERKAAHLLIEDFMLLANKEVAEFIDQKAQAQQEIPFVYRIHDLPDMNKVAEFARFATEMGKPLKIDTPRQIAQSFSDLMRAARKDERLKILEPLAIRTMAKAVYSTNNIGHYGLGFSHYAHFTSPIRRYSDVLAHRILERNLDGKTWRVDKTKLEEQCKHISNQERKAADAERESIKYKQAEWMSKHLGETFDGVISGMIERGFFVELPESRAEGLVEFKYLDDTYEVEEGNLRARGRRYKKTWKMGDRVRVRIAAVDLSRRQIEMELDEKD